MDRNKAFDFEVRKIVNFVELTSHPKRFDIEFNNKIYDWWKLALGNFKQEDEDMVPYFFSKIRSQKKSGIYSRIGVTS